METLRTHYMRLLGLDKSWQVEEVNLQVADNYVEILLKHGGGRVECPVCHAACSLAGHAPERTWRHLDTMQFETRLRARVPRSNCPACGVKTVSVPWTSRHSRFTLMFEAFAIEVLRACSSVQKACELVGIGWHGMHQIMARSVERGLECRKLDTLEHVGIDEKSFRKGHRYISTLTDLEEGRVLEVVEGRDEESADGLWDGFEEAELASIQAVAMDMWPAFANTAATHIPQADIVHDRFHISKHLNEAVDTVRRQEHKRLQKQGKDTLTGTKQLWLFNSENLTEEKWLTFEPLKNLELKTSRAWAMKENFRWFWEYKHAGHARNFFRKWYYWATHSRLKPVIKVAKMLERHLETILTWFQHRITNAVSEGLNSRIQSIKSAARGFRNFANYRIRILFFCGKLNLLPNQITY